jgi:2-polyprenyl-3-methyl-5-hydroxy-6-metoxy-1,4-benzoquinol methylase
MQKKTVTEAPLLKKTPIPNCPVCEASRGVLWTNGQDYELETNSDWWEIRHCCDCDHLWLDPRPHLEELGVIYPAHYYAYNYEQSVPYLARKGKALLDELKLKPLLSLLGREPESFLDVGCGSGRYLKLMRQKGLDCSKIFGLELSEEGVRKLREEGFQAFNERVESCTQIPESSIDVITMFHVIEHVDRPREVLEKLYGWLRPGGLLIMETPNFASLDGQIFRNRFWGGYHFPRHWNIFSKDSLTKLVTQTGFTMESLRFQTGHAFWMWSFHHWLKYGWNSPRLGRLFHPIDGALPLLAGFTAFDLLRSRMGSETSAVVAVGRRPHSSES